MQNQKNVHTRLVFFDIVTVTGESLGNIVVHYAIPRFELLQQEYIFQQDGAPLQ